MIKNFFFLFVFFSTLISAQMPELRRSFHFLTESYDDRSFCQFDINNGRALALNHDTSLSHISRDGNIDWGYAMRTHQQKYNNPSMKRYRDGYLLLDGDSLFFFSDTGNKTFLKKIHKSSNSDVWASFIDEVQLADSSVLAMVIDRNGEIADIDIFSKDSLKFIRNFSPKKGILRVLHFYEGQDRLIAVNKWGFYYIYNNGSTFSLPIPGFDGLEIEEVVTRGSNIYFTSHFKRNPGVYTNDSLVVVCYDFNTETLKWSRVFTGKYNVDIYSIVPINGGLILLGGDSDTYGIRKMKTMIIRIHLDELGNFVSSEEYRQISNGCFFYSTLDEYNWLWAVRITEDNYYPYTRNKFMERFYIEGFSQPIDSVPNEASSPSNFSLSQNYPNPFNPETSIDFNLPEAGIASLKIYDVLGREVATIFGSYKESGNQTVKFDGSSLPSGVYFYRLESSKNSQSRKMILLK